MAKKLIAQYSLAAQGPLVNKQRSKRKSNKTMVDFNSLPATPLTADSTTFNSRSKSSQQQRRKRNFTRAHSFGSSPMRRVTTAFSTPQEMIQS